MTFTEQRLQKIAEHIDMLRRLAQADGRDLAAEITSTYTKPQVGTEHQRAGTQLISQNQFETERDALLQAFRSIGHEVANLPSRFRANHPEVPWDTMAAWADGISDFSHTLCEQWLQTAAQAEAAIIHHSGVDTEIQQAVMSQIQQKTQALREQWRNTQGASHIFLWVTVVILGAWFSTLSLLKDTPSIIESSLLALLAISCITMVRAARPSKPTLVQLFKTDTRDLHTFSELYSQVYEYYAYNTSRLKWETAKNTNYWKVWEQRWLYSAVCFATAAICARIFPIP